MWRPDIVKPDPDSWGAVFDANSPYKGKVTAYDDPIYIADAALYLKATQPDLGITDVYELTDDQFNAAVDLLKQQHKIVGEYWNVANDQITSFGSGDMSMALKFMEELRTRQRAGEHICFVAMASENPDSVGPPGVADPSPDYNWKKRRR